MELSEETLNNLFRGQVVLCVWTYEDPEAVHIVFEGGAQLRITAQEDKLDVEVVGSLPPGRWGMELEDG